MGCEKDIYKEGQRDSMSKSAIPAILIPAIVLILGLAFLVSLMPVLDNLYVSFSCDDDKIISAYHVIYPINKAFLTGYFEEMMKDEYIGDLNGTLQIIILDTCDNYEKSRDDYDFKTECHYVSEHIEVLVNRDYVHLYKIKNLPEKGYDYEFRLIITEFESGILRDDVYKRVEIR